MELKGIAALVTGGASGLGEATARALAEAGAKVGVLDLQRERAETVARAIDGAAFACDVTSAESAEAAVAGAEARHGIARILVNCAGVGTPGRAVGRNGPMPLAQFAQVVAINLIGTFNLVRLVAHRLQAAPALDDGERGVMVNTASIAAFDGQVGQPAYAASKGGVAAMTLPLAREFAPHGIRVVTIAPGLFHTPMMGSLPDDVQASLAASVPFPARLGHAAEYAALVRHIIDNRMLNGETIRLDGALRMAPR
ncbi:MAG TPA: SDR family NAD(P)-dependent oxidoreductase [Candidatus Sulfotelmatobacter sp.]|nr:SDR family NAD(P)-dependent oxidoreductase [Candidatus Sulfotelmatobacter sp.]